MPDHPNAQIVRSLWTATAAGDAQRVAAVMATDATWTIHGSGLLNGEHKGHAEVLGMFARIGEQVDDIRMTLLDVYVSDTGAVARHRMEGQRGELALETEVLTVFRIQDGQVSDAVVVPRDADASDRFWVTH